jgi:hypothetical protein
VILADVWWPTHASRSPIASRAPRFVAARLCSSVQAQEIKQRHPITGQCLGTTARAVTAARRVRRSRRPADRAEAVPRTAAPSRPTSADGPLGDPSVGAEADARLSKTVVDLISTAVGITIILGSGRIKVRLRLIVLVLLVITGRLLRDSW